MGHSNGCRLLLLVAVALAGEAVDPVAGQQDDTPKGPGPSYFDTKNFNPSMAIVLVVLITAFFLLGFFSVYLRRCAGPPLGGPDEYPAARRAGLGGIASRRARGLDRAVLDSFPTMAYADVKAHHKGGSGGGALECAVCLSEFDDGDTLRLLLPACAHAFHADCIDAWLASHVTCPVCRAVLLPGAHHDAPASPAPASHTPPQQPASPEPQVTVGVVIVPAAEETEEERVRREEEAAELMRIGSVKRALRSKSGRRPGPAAHFPRSHTTGHSLAADADAERYTLRLPEHVLQEAVTASNLRRSASVQASSSSSFWTRRSGRSVRLGQSGRWPNMSVLVRTLSARLPAWGSTRRGEADAKVAGDGGGCPAGGRV
ncbi:hypothetical protein PR202_gb02870 [Eleusine coracana subsp. coracana]|uniref:RING-type E3 ubiquitin transferase n=1 Tax=Eleusine coracana subsp. coracana TaxID=191504 RepID=A0AAV5E0A4_ELECO|nr:hypothetical protein QOZ80_8BG0663680 [Eleusine coracana subsp. coracana]GJN15923.1 hypothetical protein PR202_gb02870 [Eleusine coracana subsp. coracana]